jgi:hypothetical protein
MYQEKSLQKIDGKHENLGRNIHFPVLNKSLHPSGIWTPKVYTKMLIAQALNSMASVQSTGIPNDHLYF